MAGLRLRTFASQRPRSGQYLAPILTLPASLRCSVLAAQDCTLPRHQSSRFPTRMAKVTTTDIDALWGPATPQFAYQIAERLEALIADLPLAV